MNMKRTMLLAIGAALCTTLASFAAEPTFTKSGQWKGFPCDFYDFAGHQGCVVKPKAACEGNPWTWTVQWWDAFVPGTCVPQLIAKGYHHTWIDMYGTRTFSDDDLKLMADWQAFIVRKYGLAPKANLLGLSWGGFFSTRYAAKYPDNIAKIYYDNPLMNFDLFRDTEEVRMKEIGKKWAGSKPADGVWASDPRMPVNLSKPIAQAKIPVLLLYGTDDKTCPPQTNCLFFVERFKAAGGDITIVKREGSGHHPHGVTDPKDQTIVRFFTGAAK